MIERYLIGIQADRQHNIVQQAIVSVTAVLKDPNIYNVHMRLFTTQGDLLVHL